MICLKPVYSNSAASYHSKTIGKICICSGLINICCNYWIHQYSELDSCYIICRFQLSAYSLPAAVSYNIFCAVQSPVGYLIFISKRVKNWFITITEHKPFTWLINEFIRLKSEHSWKNYICFLKSYIIIRIEIIIIIAFKCAHSYRFWDRIRIPRIWADIIKCLVWIFLCTKSSCDNCCHLCSCDIVVRSYRCICNAIHQSGIYRILKRRSHFPVRHICKSRKRCCSHA